VVRKLVDLIRLRNSHPAFAGHAHIQMSSHQRLEIEWKNGQHWARLDLDLNEPRALVTCSKLAADEEQSWDSHVSATVSGAI
jgi:sucrose phosphorylase